MEKDRKERLMRAAEMGQQLIDSGRGQELKDVLENMGIDLRDLNAVCEVCAGSGIHQVQRCPTCFGKGMMDHFSPAKCPQALP